MRIPIATDLKTRTGAPDKDARLKNCYVESKGPMNDPNNPPQTAVRKRPIAQGGIAVGTGTAQGGIGLNVNGVPYFFGFWSDTLYPYFSTGTTWNSGTSYNIGDMVSVGFVDYWAKNSNINSNPTSNPTNWSTSFIAPVPPLHTYATLDPLHIGASVTLSNGNLTLTESTIGFGASCISTISKSSGKWYWEVTINTTDTLHTYEALGAYFSLPPQASLDTTIGQTSDGYGYVSYNVPSPGSFFLINNSGPSYGATYTQGDVIGIALDASLGTITFYKNGISQGVQNTGLIGSTWYAGISATRLSASTSNSVVTVNFGATSFSYSVPSGYNAGLYI